MADPTKEQFEAAAKTVMETAPPGLSREQFFALIEKTLDSRAATSAGQAESTSRVIANASGGLMPPRKIVDELGNEVNAPSGPMGNFFRNTVRNPIAEGAAHPTSGGDVASLLLPDATLGAGDLRLPSLMKGLRRVVAEAGKASADGPLMSAPLRFIKKGISEAGRNLDIQPYMPNKSGEGPFVADAERLNRWETTPQEFGPRGGVTVAPKDSGPIIDRYMPNVSTSEAPAMAVSHPHIPYGAPQEATPALDMARLSGKAPTLTEALQDALSGVMEGDKPGLVSSHPPIETAGEGALRQSGKFGKSGSKGQPGGYSSGRPGMTDAEYDQILKKFGGREQTPYHSTADPEWHSGAESGSPEAASANKLHKAEGEMSSDFRRKMDDPLASLLMSAILGGGSARLLSSHGDQ